MAWSSTLPTDADDMEIRDGSLTVRPRGADGEGRRLELAGELDMANAATLEREIERAEREARGVLTIDLTSLEFIDSTGIAVIVAAHRRLCEEGRLRLLRSSAPAVKRVMDVTGLESKLPFAEPDEAEG